MEPAFAIQCSHMKSKKIVVLCGNPDSDSFTGAILDRYQASAEDAGHEVKRYNIGEMNFDPILHKGYKEIQPLEPDLLELQAAITECDHLVIGYPNWWCTMPASLKDLVALWWLYQRNPIRHPRIRWHQNSSDNLRPLRKGNRCVPSQVD